MSELTSRHTTSSHCLKLRHKGMYCTPDSHSDEEMAFYRDPIEATAFWCASTQKSFGPDGLPVSLEACAHGRGCCEH